MIGGLLGVLFMIPLRKLLIVREGEARGDNQVDAITGATLTCKALQKMLNEQAAVHIPLLEK